MREVHEHMVLGYMHILVI